MKVPRAAKKKLGKKRTKRKSMEEAQARKKNGSPLAEY